jgi:hypothetical protein
MIGEDAAIVHAKKFFMKTTSNALLATCLRDQVIFSSDEQEEGGARNDFRWPRMQVMSFGDT